MIPADLVAAAMERTGVPGVAVGVLHGDAEAVAGFGVTSVDNPLEVDGDTLFQIGSISKTFASTAVMRLVEMGRLELDAPVRTYVPELRLQDESVAAALTLRHLLTHTGGFEGDYFETLDHRNDDVLKSIVGRLDQLQQVSPLGKSYAYNNAGFYVIGRAIEVAAEKPFEEAIREFVLAPLALERTFVFPHEVLTQRFAVGHHRPAMVAEPWALPRATTVAGGLITSARDLLRYARLQWEPGDLLSPSSLAEQRRPQAGVSPVPWGGYPVSAESVGLSWFLVEVDGHPFVIHSGGTNGQVTTLLIAPDDHFALVVLTNHDDGVSVAQDIEREVLETQLGIASLDPARVELPEETLSEYVGVYEGQLQIAEISLVDGRLILQLVNRGGFPEADSPPRPDPAAIPIWFEAEDAAIIGDPPHQVGRAEFFRNNNGLIEGYGVGGRILRLVGPQRESTTEERV